MYLSSKHLSVVQKSYYLHFTGDELRHRETSFGQGHNKALWLSQDLNLNSSIPVQSSVITLHMRRWRWLTFWCLIATLYGDHVRTFWHHGVMLSHHYTASEHGGRTSWPGNINFTMVHMGLLGQIHTGLWQFSASCFLCSNTNHSPLLLLQFCQQSMEKPHSSRNLQDVIKPAQKDFRN